MLEKQRGCSCSVIAAITLECTYPMWEMRTERRSAKLVFIQMIGGQANAFTIFRGLRMRSIYVGSARKLCLVCVLSVLSASAGAQWLEQPGPEKAKIMLDANGQPAAELSKAAALLDFAALQQKAGAGDLAAAFELAGRFYSGSGGSTKDLAQALAWYRWAGQGGIPYAQAVAGMMYHNGQGTVADEVEAVRWWRMAAENNLPEAQFQMGDYYQTGKGGVAVDLATALSWYKKASANGLSQATNMLGVMAMDGTGVAKDPVQAVAWFRVAADAGFAAAECNLGRAYESGQGVPRDLTQALHWLQLSAQQHYSVAEHELARYYNLGIGVPVDYAQARMWLERSAADGMTKDYAANLALINATEAAAKKKQEEQVTARLDAERAEGRRYMEEAAALQLKLLNNRLASLSVTPDEMKDGGRILRVVDTYSAPSPGMQITASEVEVWSEAYLNDLTSIYASSCPWRGETVPCVRLVGQFRKYTKSGQPAGSESTNFISLRAGTPMTVATDLAEQIAFHARNFGGKPLLNSPTVAELKADARDTRQAEKTYRASVKAQQPKSSGGFGALLTAVVEAAAPLTAGADPNGIQNATNQQVGNIQARQAQIQQAQAEAAQRQAAAQQSAKERSAERMQALADQQAAAAQQAAQRATQTASPAASNAAGKVAQTPCANSNGSGLMQTANCVPASCHVMNEVVHLTSELFPPQPKADREVVGYFTNNSISDVTCTWAFHKGGQWTEVGTGLIKAGVTHQGGQGQGVWTMGADSTDMRYSCFEGHDPVDAQGHFCTLGVTFSGQTRAGTDLR